MGRGHPEFSTKKQQDVQEFMLHLLTLLERNTKNTENPGECFKFQIEERYQCSDSKKVKYLTRSDVILPLMIPMDAAVNKEEVIYCVDVRIFCNIGPLSIKKSQHNLFIIR